MMIKGRMTCIPTVYTRIDGSYFQRMVTYPVVEVDLGVSHGRINSTFSVDTRRRMTATTKTFTPTTLIPENGLR